MSALHAGRALLEALALAAERTEERRRRAERRRRLRTVRQRR